MNAGRRDGGMQQHGGRGRGCNQAGLQMPAGCSKCYAVVSFSDSKLRDVCVLDVLSCAPTHLAACLPSASSCCVCVCTFCFRDDDEQRDTERRKEERAREKWREDPRWVV